MGKRWTHKCDQNCEWMGLLSSHENAHQVFRNERKEKLKGKRSRVRATTRGLRFTRPTYSPELMAALGLTEVRA